MVTSDHTLSVESLSVLSVGRKWGEAPGHSRCRLYFYLLHSDFGEATQALVTCNSCFVGPPAVLLCGMQLEQNLAAHRLMVLSYHEHLIPTLCYLHGMPIK